VNRLSETARFDHPAPARFNAAEFLRMADLGAFEDMRVELDHGEIVRMNPPFNDHAFTLGAVMRQLFQAVQGAEMAVVPEITVDLGDETLRVFDAAIVRRSSAAERLLAPEAVVLAIEVSDTTLNYDLGPKLRDYATAAIPDYWVIDVQARVVHVMSGPTGDRYATRSTVPFGEPLALPEGLGTIVLD
jgi:Uma2 family endonuclease